MPTHPAFLAFFLLAGCATLTARPEGLVDNPVHSAGGPPSWQLEIGDDIVLRLGHAFFGGDVMYADHRYRARAPSVPGGVRRWRSGDGFAGILIEARRGPCIAADGSVHQDHVRVIRGTRRLQGCGGPVVGEARN